MTISDLLSYRIGNAGVGSTFVTPQRNVIRRNPSMTGRRRRSFVRLGRRTRRRLGFSRTATQTRQRRRMNFGRGVTRDADRRLIYRRRSMPKWKRRKWRRFSKKVQAVSTIGEGTRTVVHKPGGTSFSTQSISGQMTASFGIYTNRSTTDYLDHLHRIGNLENTGDQTSFQGGTVYSSTMYKFRSAIADFTITNRSTTNGITPIVTDPLADYCPLEIDVYEMTMSKKATYLDSGTPAELANLTDVLNFGSVRLIDNETPYPAVVASSTTLEYRGTSPWDFTNNLSQFGVKIHKKTKFFLKNGDYFTYQMRDPGNHNIMRARLEEVPGCNYPGLTKFLYIIAKPVASVLNIGDQENDVTARMVVGHSYKYTYKIEGETDDRILIMT